MNASYYKSIDFLEAAAISVEPATEAVAPNIQYDINLGKTALFVDVDSDKVKKRMQAEGIPDEAIRSATILMTAHDLTRAALRKEGHVTKDNFDPKTDHINVSVPAHLEHINAASDSLMQASINLKEDAAWWADNLDALGGSGMSETLYHEIRHMRQKYQAGKIDKRYKRKIAARELLDISLPAFAIFGAYEAASSQAGFENMPVAIAAQGLALIVGGINMHRRSKARSFDTYLSKPSEVDARQAGNEISAPYPIEINYRSVG